MTTKNFLTITLITLFSICEGVVMAYDFSFTYQGKTLYYDITSSNTAKVTFKSRYNDDYISYVTDNVVIPSNVTYNGKTYSITAIGKSAFEDCNRLTNIKIEAMITSIGEDAFEGCKRLKSIILPNSIQSIGEGAFSDCKSLTSIKIPTNITTIEEGTFSNCSSLTNIEIPAMVTYIGEDAFEGCSRLKTIYSKNTTPPIVDNEAFEGVSRRTQIYVPTNSVNAYQQTIGWQKFSTIQGKKF